MISAKANPPRGTSRSSAQLSTPRGSGGLNPKRIKVKDEPESDSDTAASKDDGVRIGRFGELYHVGSLHVAVLLESTTSHPCAEHKINK